MPLICQRVLDLVQRGLRVGGLTRLELRVANWRSVTRESFKLRQITALDQILQSGQVDAFIDLGAHVGEQTFHAAQFVPVFAFEPDPVAAEVLQLAQGQIHTQHQVEIHQSAAWVSKGYMTLVGHQKGPNNTGSSSLIRSKRNLRGGPKYRVETVDIAAFIDQLPFKRVLVKCDIEGAEYRVLKSLMRSSAVSKIGAIFTEFHDQKIPWNCFKAVPLRIGAMRRGLDPSIFLAEWI